MSSRRPGVLACLAPVALILAAAAAPDGLPRTVAPHAPGEACTRTVALRPVWGHCAALEVELACTAPRRVVACWHGASGAETCTGSAAALAPGERAEMLVCGADAGLRLAACSDGDSCRTAARPRRLQSSALY
jgi:hypothetical protein